MQTQTLTALMEPAIIVIMALVVVVLYTFYIPAYDTALQHIGIGTYISMYMISMTVKSHTELYKYFIIKGR